MAVLRMFGRGGGPPGVRGGRGGIDRGRGRGRQYDFINEECLKIETISGINKNKNRNIEYTYMFIDVRDYI